MTRVVALAFSAAFLLTGCFFDDDDDDFGTVNLYWDFVRSAPAQPGGLIVYDDDDGELEGSDGPCEESGVELVTVESPVGPFTVDCVYGLVEGVAIDGIVEGNRPFRITGWRGNPAVAVYDRSFTLAVRGNAATDHFLDVTGVSQPLDLFADLAFGVPGELYLDCAEAGSPALEFEIRDFFGALVEQGSGIACTDPLPAPVFVGNLELDNYTVRMRGRSSGNQVVLDSCDVPLDHFARQTGEEGFLATLFANPLPVCTQ